MRILLINPPLLPVAEQSPPVGLCTLAAVLIDRGNQVHILDLNLEIRTATSDRREKADAFLKRALAEIRPSLVCITSMYNNSLQAELIVRQVKAYRDDIVVVAGGPHFGAMPHAALNRVPELDFVVEGEGETALCALVDVLESELLTSAAPNLWYRGKQGEIVRNARDSLIDMSTIPVLWPRIGEAISVQRYADTVTSRRRAMYLEAGRGCPYKCTFCAPAQFWDRDYRVKSPQVLVHEMQYMKETFGYNAFMLVHDLLTANRKFVVELAQAIIDAELNIEWMANARADRDLQSIYPLMRRSGCWKLFYGIESGSRRLQLEFGKGLTHEDSVSTIHASSQQGIGATCSFVIGFQSESPSELSSSLKLGAHLKLLGAETVQFHRLRMFPPAPMAYLNLEMEFDLETLRLEYPFADLREEEFLAINADSKFYSGYFAPKSAAGSSENLAQVELFFQHAVAIAPITMAVLADFANDRLVAGFYEVLESIGRIDRCEIDWGENALLVNWQVIDPYLRALADLFAQYEWQRTLLNGTIRYEKTRLQVVVSDTWDLDDALVSAPGCLAFSVDVDIFALLDRLKAASEVTPLLARTTSVVLIRNQHGEIAALQGVE